MPLEARVPYQPVWSAFAFPDALQSPALLDAQEMDVVVSAGIVAAPSVIVGAAGLPTADVTLSVTGFATEVPPSPEHAKLKVSGPKTVAVMV